jgi:hypothetical protein
MALSHSGNVFYAILEKANNVVTTAFVLQRDGLIENWPTYSIAVYL